jgi:hypothetical protein
MPVHGRGTRRAGFSPRGALAPPAFVVAHNRRYVLWTPRVSWSGLTQPPGGGAKAPRGLKPALREPRNA